MKRALAGAACSLALVLAVCLFAAVRRALRRRRRPCLRRTPAVRPFGLYRCALHLNGGAPLPEHIVLLAEKAKFFRGGLSAQGDGWLAWLCRRTRKVAARTGCPAAPSVGYVGLMPVLKQRGCALDAQTRIQTAFAEGKME